MDRDIGLKEYPYLSRYQGVRVMTDGKNEYHGTVKWIADAPYTIHKTTVGDTLESLALKYYGTPTRYWVIADFNRIIDVFAPLEEGKELKLIQLNAINFKGRL